MAPTVSHEDDSLDMDKIISCMTRELNCFRSLYEPNDRRIQLCSIHRIPQHIRQIDRIAYEPIVLSIGPYHHGGESLRFMEKQKWESLYYILKLNCQRSLQDYLKCIARLEKLARKCYSEEVNMERKPFLQMLLLDGCFILVNIDKNISERPVSPNMVSQEKELGRSAVEISIKLKKSGLMDSKVTGHQHVMENSSLMSELGEVNISQERHSEVKIRGDNLDSHDNDRDWCSIFAWHDMLLLENQIPLMVVLKIYELLAGNDSAIEVLKETAAECMEDILSKYPIAIHECNRPRNAQHLLHLCHIYLRPSQKLEHYKKHESKPRFLHRLIHYGHKYIGHFTRAKGSETNVSIFEQVNCPLSGDQPSRWRRAAQYHEAGIGFKRREYYQNNRHSLLDIKFSKGTIEVPFFPIDENTESLFKNLIAFEQMDPRFGNDITAYIIFMSQFVSNPDDVILLTQRGIIVHLLDTDDDVSALFTRLTTNVAFNPDSYYYLKSLCNALEFHYQSRLRRWVAWLWRNHFRNPWLALAVLATTIMLVCTVVQTIYTVLPYVKPREQS